MSDSTPGIEVQLQHLLDVVTNHRNEKCEQLLTEARNQASEIVKQAYRETRLRMRDDIASLREEIRNQLASASARQQTRARHRRQVIDHEVLKLVWEPLAEALVERWQNPDSRRCWVSSVVERASAILTERHWRIQYGSDWPELERADLQANLGNTLQHIPQFEIQPSITAGLRIFAGDTCVDGTVEGLLHDRIRIGALLLGRIHETTGSPQ